MDLQEFFMTEALILEEIELLKEENAKLKQENKRLKQNSFKRELNYGQGYKAYATEKGVIVE